MQKAERYLWELPQDQRTAEVLALIKRILAESDLEYDTAFEAGYLKGIAEQK